MLLFAAVLMLTDPQAELERLGMVDIKPLAQLGGYVLVAAKPCANCPQDRALYLYRSGAKPHQFTHPGRILDPKKRELVHDSRAFYGRCLGGADSDQDVYMVYQREKIDRRPHLQTSVMVTQIGADSLREKLHEKRLPSLKVTLAKVKAKLCWEVEGRNRYMLNQSLDLRPRRDADENEEEEEDADDASALSPKKEAVESAE